ncbi:unnamed protein product [Staurois parvus]|uniref:Uncharacterized protein n=1 Tax=Staurois parvus TaxID=386267 RepID=A0ABN9EJN9_9NEOB|nr:unnamed protein product [Staurois parvus]
MSILCKAKTCLAALLALICYTDLFYTVWNMTHNFPRTASAPYQSTNCWSHNASCRMSYSV